MLFPICWLKYELIIKFISVINQLDAQKFWYTISLFHASTCFEHNVLIIRRSKLYYTASGIVTPVGGHPKFIICLYMFRALCAHHKEVKIVLYSIWYHHTYRCWIIQFWPPDDEHMVLETCSHEIKLIVKQIFVHQVWLITKTNALRCTVSKT